LKEPTLAAREELIEEPALTVAEEVVEDATFADEVTVTEDPVTTQEPVLLDELPVETGYTETEVVAPVETAELVEEVAPEAIADAPAEAEEEDPLASECE